MHPGKNVARLTAALLLVSTLVIPSFAATGTVATDGAGLNVRNAGNTTAQIVGQLNSGAQVEILGVTESGWYKIQLPEGEGFVSGEFVTVDPQQAASIPAVTEPFYVRILVPSQNVRSGPGTEFDLAGSLTQGTVVQVTGVENGWYRISNGYISPDYSEKCSAPVAGGKGAEVVNFALQYVGYPYVHAGSSPAGFDCSGFTSFVYRQFGITISHSSDAQLGEGTAVSLEDIQPGDILVWSKNGSGRASHVGLYIGDGKFVHASNPSSGVKISSLSEAYYSTGLVGIRRVLP